MPEYSLKITGRDENVNQIVASLQGDEAQHSPLFADIDDYGVTDVHTYRITNSEGDLVSIVTIEAYPEISESNLADLVIASPPAGFELETIEND